MPIPIILAIAGILVGLGLVSVGTRGLTGGDAKLKQQIQQFRAQGYSDADILAGMERAGIARTDAQATLSNVKRTGLSEEDRKSLAALGVSFDGMSGLGAGSPYEQMSNRLYKLVYNKKIPEAHAQAILAETASHLNSGGTIEELPYYQWMDSAKSGYDEGEFDFRIGQLSEAYTSEYESKARIAQAPYWRKIENEAQERQMFQGLTAEEARQRERTMAKAGLLVPKEEETTSLTPEPEIAPILDPYLAELYPNIKQFYEGDIKQVLTDPAMAARQMWLSNIHAAERALTRYEGEKTAATEQLDKARTAAEGYYPGGLTPESELEVPGGRTYADVLAAKQAPLDEVSHREQQLSSAQEMVGFGSEQKAMLGAIEDPLKKHLREFRWEEQFLRLPPEQRGFRTSRTAPMAVWGR